MKEIVHEIMRSPWPMFYLITVIFFAFVATIALAAKKCLPFRNYINLNSFLKPNDGRQVEKATSSSYL